MPWKTKSPTTAAGEFVKESAQAKEGRCTETGQINWPERQDGTGERHEKHQNR
jgi:hypothetical protein